MRETVQERVRRVLNANPEQRRVVIEVSILNGWTEARCARTLGLTRQRVHQIRKEPFDDWDRIHRVAAECAESERRVKAALDQWEQDLLRHSGMVDAIGPYEAETDDCPNDSSCADPGCTCIEEVE